MSTEFTPLLQDDNEDKMDKMLCENVRTNGLTIFKLTLICCHFLERVKILSMFNSTGAPNENIVQNHFNMHC